MFTSKKKLAEKVDMLQQIVCGPYWSEGGNMRNHIELLFCDIERIEKKIDMILRHLDLEVVYEPEKKYLRKKVEEEKK